MKLTIRSAFQYRIVRHISLILEEEENRFLNGKLQDPDWQNNHQNIFARRLEVIKVILGAWSIGSPTWWLTDFCSSSFRGSTSSSGLFGCQVCMWCRHVYAGKHLCTWNKNKSFKESSFFIYAIRYCANSFLSFKLLFLLDKASLCSSGWPGTYYVNQTGFELMEISLSLESFSRCYHACLCALCHIVALLFRPPLSCHSGPPSSSLCR